MGCDIHMYVEYKRKERSVWSSFGGKINPGRNYNMFARMAGVRGEFEGVSLEPKGMPEDAGYKANDGNRLYITDTEGEEYVTMETAQKWVDSNSSVFINGSDGKPLWVTHPDWHSHTWLSADEYRDIVRGYHEQVKGADTYNKESEYKAILAAMESLQADGYEVRVVLWFDN